MKRFILVCMLGLIGVPVFANVFASELTVTPSGGNFTLAYRLNDAADSVNIAIKGPAPATDVVRTISLGSQSKGAQSTIWDGKKDDSSDAAAGAYTWEVTASQTTGYSVPTMLGNDLGPLSFYSPYGVSVVNNEDCDTFGRVYVSNAAAGTAAATSRAITKGIYVLSSDLTDITGQADTGYGSGIAWATGSGVSPRRVRTAEDGMVYVCDFSDSHSGIWVMNPASPSTLTELFDDSLTRASSGLRTNLASQQLHGSIGGFWANGVGANRKLFTLDEDMTSGSVANSVGSAWMHSVGTAVSGWNIAPTNIYLDGDNGPIGNTIINYTGTVQVDPNGSGYFVSQYRYDQTAANPCLIHVLNDGTVDWRSSVDAALSKFNALVNGAFAVNAPRTSLAVYNGYVSTARVINVYSMSDYPSFSNAPAWTTGAGTASFNDVAWDAAGNLYAVSSSAEVLRVWSPPSGANSFTTSAPSTQGITVVTGVTEWLNY